MKRYWKSLGLYFFCFSYCLYSQDIASNKDKTHSIGFSIGATFGGPANKFSDYLEQQGFGVTSDSFFFGPIPYPVKTGPRGSFSLNYLFKLKNRNHFGLTLGLDQLGEVAGLNSSGLRIEAGFKSYALSANYTFGPRQSKISIGPSLMLNSAYSIDFNDFEESKRKITNQLTLGITVSALLYLWNKSVTYSNIGFSYLISYPVEQGPFPIDSRDELGETKLNYSHGAIFLSFGFQLK